MPTISDQEFRDLLTWFMCSDPWPVRRNVATETPIDEPHHDRMAAMLDRFSAEHGFDGWVEAFHRYEPAVAIDDDNQINRLRALLDPIVFQEDGHMAVHLLSERFGFTYGTLWRSDVEEYAERELTDEEWEKVRYCKTWRDVLPDMGAGNAEIIWSMLATLGIPTADELDDA